MDCSESCPVPPSPEPLPVPFLIFGIDGYAVVMAFIFVIGSALFVIGAGYCSQSSETGKLKLFDNICRCLEISKFLCSQIYVNSPNQTIFEIKRLTHIRLFNTIKTLINVFEEKKQCFSGELRLNK